METGGSWFGPNVCIAKRSPGWLAYYILSLLDVDRYQFLNFKHRAPRPTQFVTLVCGVTLVTTLPSVPRRSILRRYIPGPLTAARLHSCSIITMSPATLDIPIFAGQGTSGASAACTQALQDARSSSGTTLLSACHEIFHNELASLPPDLLSLASIEISDFESPESLLKAPGTRYERNPVISGTTLFLFQSLGYLSFIEGSAVAEGSRTPFSDALKRTHSVLGFSSGILPACVAASSSDLISYISHSAQAYRLAFWVGIRAQIYCATVRDDAPGIGINDGSPWSVVILGVSKEEAEELLRPFQKVKASPLLKKNDLRLS